MKRYEAVLALDPDLEEKDLADFREVFNKLLKNHKAKGIKVLEDGVRDLAHAINKHPRGHLWRLSFEAEPQTPAALREEIRHDPRLLRQTYLQAVRPAVAQEEKGETEEKKKSESKPEQEKEKPKSKAKPKEKKPKQETEAPREVKETKPEKQTEEKPAAKTKKKETKKKETKTKE